MKIQIDSNNIITSYAKVGDIENSIEVKDNQLPSDFYDDYKRNFYKYDEENKIVVKNEDYEENDYLTDTNNNLMLEDNKPIDNEKLSKVISMLSVIQKTNVKTTMINDNLIKQNAKLSKDVVELKNKINQGGE